MSRNIFSPIFLLLSLASCLVRADQNPETRCPGGATNLANGLASACDLGHMDGLQGHAASQILYEISMESELPNSTFFGNGQHVTCLFQNSSFGLSGIGIGIGPVTLTIPPLNFAGSELAFLLSFYPYIS